jgi:hypothetical protein
MRQIDSWQQLLASHGFEFAAMGAPPTAQSNTGTLANIAFETMVAVPSTVLQHLIINHTAPATSTMELLFVCI